MALAKRQGREKPVKREQRKVRGPGWEPEVKQTALSLSSLSLFPSSESACPHTSRCIFLCLPNKTELSIGCFKFLLWWDRTEEITKSPDIYGAEQAQFRLLFLYVSLLPLSLPYVNWASQEGCLLHLRFSLQSSDLPFFCFHGLFPSLSFSHCHSGLLFPILTT